MVEGISILTSWFQNIGLLLKQKIQLPIYFEYIKGIYNLFLTFEISNIPLVDEISTYFTLIKRFSRIDYRVQFIIFNVVLPLCFTLATLFVFMDFYIVVWYIIMLFSITVFIVGLFTAIFFSSDIPLINSLSMNIMGVTITPSGFLVFSGFILLVITLVIGLVVFLIKKCCAKIRHRRIRKEIEKKELKSLNEVGKEFDKSERDMEFDIKELGSVDEKESDSEVSSVDNTEKEKEYETTNVEPVTPLPTIETIQENKFPVIQNVPQQRVVVPDVQSYSQQRYRAPQMQQMYMGQRQFARVPPVQYVNPQQIVIQTIPPVQQQMRRRVYVNPQPQVFAYSPPPMIQRNYMNVQRRNKVGGIKRLTNNGVKLFRKVKKWKKKLSRRRKIRDFRRGSSRLINQIEIRKLEIARNRKMKFNCWKVMKLFIYCLCFLIPGLFLTPLLKFEYFGWRHPSYKGQSCHNILDCLFEDFLFIGIILICISFFPVLLFFAHLIPFCRRMDYQISKFVSAHSLKFIFIFITMLFTPMITSIFTMFVCQSCSCPVNTQFPQRFSGLNINTLLKGSEGNVCTSCVFDSQCTIADELCPPVSDIRLSVDSSLSCFGDIAVFFWFPALICGAIWIISLPIFYIFVVLSSSKKLRTMDVDCLLKKNIPLWIKNEKKAAKLARKEIKMKQKNPSSEGIKRKKKYYESDYLFYHPKLYKPTKILELEDFYLKNSCDEKVKHLDNLSKTERKKLKKEIKNEKNEKWKIRTHLTKSPVKSLFSSFEYKWRFFKVFNNVQKIFLVGISVCLISLPKVSVPSSLLIHMITAVLFIFTFPFIDYLEDLIYIVINVTTLITCSYLIFPTFEISIPNFIPLIILGGNVLVPILGLIQVFVSICFRGRRVKHYYNILKKLDEAQEEGWINVRKKINYKNKLSELSSTDEMISNSVMKKVKAFFMMIGIACFIAASGSIVGLLFHEIQPLSIKTSSQFANQVLDCDEMNLIEFAGYNSWKNFTENCCCTRFRDYEDSLLNRNWLEVEMWKCLNGKFKEHVRVESNYGRILNGSKLIRGFCEREFNEGLFLIEETNIDLECNFHYVNGTLNNTLDNSSMNLTKTEIDYIFHYLW